MIHNDFIELLKKNLNGGSLLQLIIPIAKSLKIRKKEITFHSIVYYIDSFFSFAFDAKETKDQGKKNAPPFFRPTHNDSDCFKSLYWFCSEWCKTLLHDMAGTERHCVPPC